MKSKLNSRAMRRQFGGDMKQLMSMLSEVRILIDSELMKQPEGQNIVLSKEDLKKQIKSCFAQLEREMSSIPEESKESKTTTVGPSIRINSRRG